MVVQEDGVDPDEFGPHRDGDMHDDGEFLPGLSRLMGRSALWDEWDDEPTHEKWRRGPKWN